MTIGEAIGGILPLAIAVDISVLSIIAVILMLITPRGAQQRSRTRGGLGEQAPAPKWMAALDSFTRSNRLAWVRLCRG